MKQAKGLYQSGDGKLWRSMKLCKSHNAWLELVELCKPPAHDLRGDTHGHIDLALWLLKDVDAFVRVLRSDPIRDGGELPEDEVTT